MESRRRTERYSLAFPVLVECGGAFKRVLGVNVSEAGMLILSAEPYPVGHNLRVTFSLPTTDVELVAEAQVRHVSWDSTAAQGQFRVGVEFGHFEEGDLHPPIRSLPN